MTIAEKLTRAKADLDSVYNAGYTKGLDTSGNEYPLSEWLKVRTCTYLFAGCSSSVLETIELIDFSNVTDMNNMFYNCQLTTVPLFDTRNVNDMSYMFSYCSKLTDVPLFDTRNVINMSFMFSYCSQLTTVPLFDTRNVNDMSYMFSYCRNLTTVPLFDTRNATTMINMFYDCRQLTTVPLFDTRNVNDMSYMFYDCKALTDVRLRNIKRNLQVGSGTSWGHKLTVDSLVHLIYELRDTGSSKKLTVGSANLEKLANVYVRVIDITDEMRAEDDLIDEKLPFEVCESTDEGAMLITDYVSAKNWALL